MPPRSALWLNWRGERIWPPLVSGYDTRDLVTQICAQDKACSWQLLNRRIALKELAISGAEFNPSIRNHSKLGVLRDLLLGNRRLVDEVLTHSTDVVTGQSLEELAERMNALQGDQAVDAKALRDMVVRYDQEVAEAKPAPTCNASALPNCGAGKATACASARPSRFWMARHCR